MMRFLAMLLASFLSVAPAYAQDSGKNMYDTISNFTPDAWLIFEDFSLRYVGERVVEPSGRITITMRFQQFDVNTSQGMQRIEWSAGTGDIGPAKFAVGAKNFYLELQRTMLPRNASDPRDIGQALGDYQLVILTESTFNALKQAMYAR